MKSTDLPQMTPTQRRMLALLSDGKVHSKEEMHKCLCDELGRIENISPHVTHLRQQLRTVNRDLVCEHGGGYRLVAHIMSH